MCLFHMRKNKDAEQPVHVQNLIYFSLPCIKSIGKVNSLVAVTAQTCLRQGYVKGGSLLLPPLNFPYNCQVPIHFWMYSEFSSVGTLEI